MDITGGEGINVYADAKTEYTRQLTQFCLSSYLSYFLGLLEESKESDKDGKKLFASGLNILLLACYTLTLSIVYILDTSLSRTSFSASLFFRLCCTCFVNSFISYYIYLILSLSSSVFYIQSSICFFNDFKSILKFYFIGVINSVTALKINFF